MPPSRVVLLDGGVGHILKLKSADTKGHLNNFLGGALAPASAIKEAHRSFVDAGADLLTTATFGVTPGSLRRAGFPESELEGITRRVARVAVEVAAEENRRRREEEEEREGDGGDEEHEGGRGRGRRRRRRRRVLVAGCLPPLGDNCYLPSSSSSPASESDGSAATAAAAAVAVYERIAAALLEAGVDLFLVETCSDSADAEAAVQGAAAAAAAAAAASSASPSPTPPLWLSFTVDDEDPSRLRGGEELEAAATRALLEPKGGGGGGGRGGREEEEGGGGEGGKGETGHRIPVSALLLNCSSPRAVSVALPLLRRAVERSLERRREGEKEEEVKEVGLGCYANGFQLSTTSWLRSEGTLLPLPPPPAAAAAPAAASAADEAEDGTNDYDEGGMITPEAYARHARGWLKSCPFFPSSSASSPSSPSASPSPSASSSFFVLGGCCGVGPEHVRALRSLLDSEEEGSRPL